MNSIKEVLNHTLNQQLKQIIISNPRDKEKYTKIKIRPTLQKERLVFHVEKLTKTQAFHQNLDKEGCMTAIHEFAKVYGQIQVYTESFNYNILISKKGKVSIGKKKVTGQTESSQNQEQVQGKDAEAMYMGEGLSHNRKKKYILQEGMAIPFLVDLGVMTKEGKVVRAKYDKFRQINRFLEFIQDILPKLETDREVKIIDIGCGKSALTFAVYHYLHVIQGLDVNIIGIDLKEEMINKCTELAKKYEYKKLAFQKGDIANFQLASDETVDMVISLHACDTATDVALVKAITWGAKIILAVPCCQSQLNQQIENHSLRPLLKHGLLKERFASLATDGIRGGYLEAMGYKTQMLEFIEMEHTPKNLLIRGMKEGERNPERIVEIQGFEKSLNVKSTIGVLLADGECPLY